MTHYGQPPPGAGFGPPPGPTPIGPRLDTLAIVALVGGLLSIVGAIANLASGFLGMCCPFCTIGAAIIGAIIAIPALLGVVLGLLSYKRTKDQPELYSGKGLALTGAISGAFALLLTIATIVGPWIGFGCMSATRPPPAPIQSPLPPIPPVDPLAVDAGTAGTACARLAPCCRAYVAEMQGSIPASTCDAYNDVTQMSDAVCGQTMVGYRTALTVLGRTVPPECN
jgi:hypothetical protein